MILHQLTLITDIEIKNIPQSVEELVYIIITEPLEIALYLSYLLERVDIKEAELKEVELIEANIKETDLNGTDFNGTDLKNSDRLMNTLRECVFETKWLWNPEAVWKSFLTLMEKTLDQLLLERGNYFYDREDFRQSYSIYLLVCQRISRLIPYIYDPNSLNESYLVSAKQCLTTEQLDVYSCALSNMGNIHLMIDDIKSGLDLHELAYRIYPSNRILVSLLRCKIEFLNMDARVIGSDYLSQLLTDRDEIILGFLVWFFQQCNEEEESITSYLQLQTIEYRLKYLKYYMHYMIRSNQLVAMKHFLQTIMDLYPLNYYFTLIQVFVEGEDLERALEAFQEWDLLKYNFDSPQDIKQNDSMQVLFVFKDVSSYLSIGPLITESSMNMLRSFVSLKRNQVIQAINYVNLIKIEDLTSTQRLEYHLHLAQLSKLSTYGTREHVHFQSILALLQEKYRQLYLSIQTNQRKGLQGEKVF